MNQKKFFLLSFMICLCSQVFGQLTIEECYTMGQRNYPLINQYVLIEKSREYSISNVAKGYLPQLGVSGQITYQSEVTEFPISLPNVTIPSLSKDQYKISAEILQPITGLITVKNNIELVKTNTAMEKQKIDVELYKLKERINRLFFGIILIDAQIKQTELLKTDIQKGIEKTNSAIINGITLKSSADILKVELLNTNQKIIELKAMRKGYADMLSLLINYKISETTQFERPKVLALSSTINRPELNLFETQKNALNIQERLLNNRNIPHVNLFLQGGYGKPGLNFLSNDFSFYYIGGIRLSWNISGLYTYRKQKKDLILKKESIDVQQDLFLFNTNLALTQKNAEIIKLKRLIESDYEIIKLRESVKNRTKNQLENGTATASDYILQINAEDRARNSLLLHEIQLLMTQYNYKITSGN
ncbi:transporter [Porphyromonadaceae bacterium COT-184 OH4590]|nr:transporter [Porphyromonadaceae bacterium COT-184 OH4590]